MIREVASASEKLELLVNEEKNRTGLILFSRSPTAQWSTDNRCQLVFRRVSVSKLSNNQGYCRRWPNRHWKIEMDGNYYSRLFLSYWLCDKGFIASKLGAGLQQANT